MSRPEPSPPLVATQVAAVTTVMCGVPLCERGGATPRDADDR